ncbi:unnamed protein product [Phytophthora lilii]|uniref:Unnamed protein product n=1 Tax=Phytophthora lilii TaxID=2077276 RepID=A0A9W7CT83_9STRA|nr:unnamed protein product [Phytophthora lilii]
MEERSRERVEGRASFNVSTVAVFSVTAPQSVIAVCINSSGSGGDVSLIAESLSSRLGSFSSTVAMTKSSLTTSFIESVAHCTNDRQLRPQTFL